MTQKYLIDDEEPNPKSWLLTAIIWLLIIGTCVAFYALCGKGIIRETKIQYRQFFDTSFLQSDYVPSVKYSVLGSITGYSKDETCPNRDCITASGQEAGTHIIACPYNIKLGTIVDIESIGRRVCGDRTAYWVQNKYGDTFDLWFENYELAKSFGRQNLVVKILNN